MKRRDKLTAVYCRVAQPDDFATHMQKVHMRQFAESQGYNGVVYYLDNGYSGLSFERPAFLKMQKDIQAGKIQRVIVNSLSRIGRDCFKVHSWLKETQRMGIEILSLDGSHMALRLFG